MDPGANVAGQRRGKTMTPLPQRIGPDPDDPHTHGHRLPDGGFHLHTHDPVEHNAEGQHKWVRAAPPDPQRERIAALEAALRALVDEEGDDDDFFGIAQCPGCWRHGAGRIRDMAHAPDCPWVAARELLHP